MKLGKADKVELSKVEENVERDVDIAINEVYSCTDADTELQQIHMGKIVNIIPALPDSSIDKPQQTNVDNSARVNLLTEQKTFSKPVNANFSHISKEAINDVSLIKEFVLKQNECFSFDKLLASLSFVEKPNKWWNISPVTNFIACVRWTADYNTDRKVVIESDLTAKVYHYFFPLFLSLVHFLFAFNIY